MRIKMVDVLFIVSDKPMIKVPFASKFLKLLACKRKYANEQNKEK